MERRQLHEQFTQAKQELYRREKDLDIERQTLVDWKSMAEKGHEHQTRSLRQKLRKGEAKSRRAETQRGILEQELAQHKSGAKHQEMSKKLLKTQQDLAELKAKEATKTPRPTKTSIATSPFPQQLAQTQQPGIHVAPVPKPSFTTTASSPFTRPARSFGTSPQTPLGVKTVGTSPYQKIKKTVQEIIQNTPEHLKPDIKTPLGTPDVGTPESDQPPRGLGTTRYGGDRPQYELRDPETATDVSIPGIGYERRKPKPPE